MGCGNSGAVFHFPRHGLTQFNHRHRVVAAEVFVSALASCIWVEEVIKWRLTRQLVVSGWVSLDLTSSDLTIFQENCK
jgi:hypothetical protein